MIDSKKDVEMVQLSKDNDFDSLKKWARDVKFPWLMVAPKDVKSTGLAELSQGGVPQYTLINTNGDVVAQGKHAAMEFIKKQD